MRESTVNAAVNKKLRELFPDGTIWKINDSSRPGTLDNLYSIGPGSQAWVEFKWSAKPAKTIKLTNKSEYLSANQFKEIKRLLKIGDVVKVLLATPMGFIMVDGEDVETPIPRDNLVEANTRTLTNKIVDTIKILLSRNINDETCSSSAEPKTRME